MLTVILKQLKELEVVAHYEHLATHSYARHMALGGLYDGIGGFVDRLAEAILPRESLAMPSSLNLNYTDQFESFDMYLESIKNMLSTYENSYSNQLEIQNILSEIKELISKTLYLFTLT